MKIAIIFMTLFFYILYHPFLLLDERKLLFKTNILRTGSHAYFKCTRFNCPFHIPIK